MDNDERKALVGQRRLLPFGEMDIAITIAQVRRCYGRIDVLIKPVAGSGEEWVRLTGLELIK